MNNSRVMVGVLIALLPACDREPEAARRELALAIAEDEADLPAPQVANVEAYDAPTPVVMGAGAAAELGLGPELAREDLVDEDGDGVPAHLDCDDRDPGVSPNAIEDFCDQRDQNCNGLDECDGDRDGVQDAFDLDPTDPAVGRPDQLERSTASD